MKKLINIFLLLISLWFSSPCFAMNSDDIKVKEDLKQLLKQIEQDRGKEQKKLLKQHLHVFYEIDPSWPEKESKPFEVSLGLKRFVQDTKEFEFNLKRRAQGLPPIHVIDRRLPSKERLELSRLYPKKHWWKSKK